jgi:hypothetical protein
MTPRTMLVTVAALLALAPAGCRKPPATNAIPGTGAGATVPASGLIAVSDYRTLTKKQLEDLLRDKSGNAVTLTSVGPNQYTGTRPSPDGTAQLQVAVTVEADRVIIETRGGGLSAREYITPRGYEAENVR